MSDALMRRLEALPVAEPDSTRTEHIRKRCHAQLERRARRGAPSHAPPVRRRPLPIWQSFVAVLGLVYLAEVIRFALAVCALA